MVKHWTLSPSGWETAQYFQSHHIYSISPPSPQKPLQQEHWDAPISSSQRWNQLAKTQDLKSLLSISWACHLNHYQCCSAASRNSKDFLFLEQNWWKKVSNFTSLRSKQVLALSNTNSTHTPQAPGNIFKIPLEITIPLKGPFSVMSHPFSLPGFNNSKTCWKLKGKGEVGGRRKEEPPRASARQPGELLKRSHLLLLLLSYSLYVLISLTGVNTKGLFLILRSKGGISEEVLPLGCALKDVVVGSVKVDKPKNSKMSGSNLVEPPSSMLEGQGGSIRGAWSLWYTSKPKARENPNHPHQNRLPILGTSRGTAVSHGKILTSHGITDKNLGMTDPFLKYLPPA